MLLRHHHGRAQRCYARPPPPRRESEVAPIQPVLPLPFFRVQQITSHHESLFSARAAFDCRMLPLIRLPRLFFLFLPLM